MSFVREHFPHLLEDYRKRFAKADFVDATYRETVSERVRTACRKHGLARRSTDSLLSNALGSQAAGCSGEEITATRAHRGLRRTRTGAGSLFAIA